MATGVAAAGDDWYADVPRSIRKHTVFGVALMVAAFGGFGAWALQAPLAAAVIAYGGFAATGHNKILQHLEGGIITEILAAEGDAVRAGQPLIRLDQTAALAREQELFLRRARLEAISARLAAQAEGRDTLVFPAFLTENARATGVAEIMASQTRAFAAARRQLDQELAILVSALDALSLRRAGYEAQLTAEHETTVLLNADLAAKRTLLDKGLARADSVYALQRALAESRGQTGKLEAQLDEIDELIAKQHDEIAKARTAYAKAAIEELQAVEIDLDGAREQHVNARSVRERALIAAPVDGVVVQMHYNTPGGVIEPGRKILEILPQGAPLMVEAKVGRSDIDSVKVGQHATVRLVGLNQRTTPVLQGDVFFVSPDSIREREGDQLREHYLVRIKLSDDELARVEHFSPTPGMPAEIMIETQMRTFAEYLVKPITDSMARAFRED
jgi:HlyD family secretion protein